MDGNFAVKLDFRQDYLGGLKIKKTLMLKMWHLETYSSKHGEFVRI